MAIIFYSLTYERGEHNRIIQMERNTTVLSIYDNPSEHNNTYVLYKNGERKSLNYDLKVEILFLKIKVILLCIFIGKTQLFL